MSRRRTFAAGILPSAHSVLTRFGILPARVSKRRLPGTGSPSLACSPWLPRFLRCALCRFGLPVG
jgi:hypothetical protein